MNDMQNNNSTPLNPDVAYSYLDKSPMFKFSLSSKELFHSNFLEWLYYVDKDKFKNLIQKMAGLDSYGWPGDDNWLVKREYNNFDLCIVETNAQKNVEETEDGEEERLREEGTQKGDNDNNKVDSNFRILFVIENKVKSIPYKEQLIRYAKEAESINEAYWKSKGKDVLARLGFNIDNKDWIGVKDSKWVLKRRDGKNGRIIVWSEPIEIIKDRTLVSGVEGNSSVTKFLNDFASHNSRSCPVYYILLSLASTFPGSEIKKGIWELKESEEVDNSFKCDWRVFNYSSYYQSIQSLFIIPSSTDLNNLIIQDYCRFLESLTFLVDVWQEDYDTCIKPFLSEGNGSYTRAKEHRIHDLYQKLKFSYLCAGLFNTIKNNYGNTYTVYPSNQSGLFKEKKDSPFEAGKDYICVNYTYLHGAPLLEINVHPKCNAEKDVELYYAIQVQGKAYEKGIQVKKNGFTEKVLRHNNNDLFSKTIWKSLTSNEKKLELKVSNWMTLDSIDPEDKTNDSEDKTNYSEKKMKPYNKYDMSDGSYIYQSQKHNKAITIEIEKATISEVIDCMLQDLAYVVDSLR